MTRAVLSETNLLSVYELDCVRGRQGGLLFLFCNYF